MEERMRRQLTRRQEQGSLRQLLPISELDRQTHGCCPDFSSNDYLGLAHCTHQQEFVDKTYETYIRKQQQKQQHGSMQPNLGATGSRLLSGDSVLVRQLETQLAEWHKQPAALVCNSGYDANLSILSSIPLPHDVVLLDELCHNSLVMGLRSSRVECHESFRHNDLGDLGRLLEKYKQGKSTTGSLLLVVESVYSMDGDIAPLQDILDMAQQYDAMVVVDEAHGLGLYGRTNRDDLGLSSLSVSSSTLADDPGGTGVLGALQLESHPALLCSIHTFGKAAGAHGAVICGSQTLKEYLINYARPFVYSTALPTHSLIVIQCSYLTMTSHNQGDARRRHVFGLVKLFRKLLLQVLPPNNTTTVTTTDSISLFPSPSPIQALVVRGNDTCVEFCNNVRVRSGIRLFPIRAPTVPRGQERVRIILHAHNSEAQVRRLAQTLVATMHDMGALPKARL